MRVLHFPRRQLPWLIVDGTGDGRHPGGKFGIEDTTGLNIQIAWVRWLFTVRNALIPGWCSFSRVACAPYPELNPASVNRDNGLSALGFIDINGRIHDLPENT